MKISAGELTLDGALRANGQNGGQYTGGGSGGAIWIDAGVLSGSGSVQANGGEAGADGGGDGGGGRVAVYAQALESFAPATVEAKAGAGAQWGSMFMGLPHTVNVTLSGQGSCTPSGAVAIPYGATNTFAFTPVPVSLTTNGVAVAVSGTLEWVNAGLWRGTQADAFRPPRSFSPEAWVRLAKEAGMQYAVFTVLWYDGAMVPGGRDPVRHWRSVELNRMVHALQPDILINDRAHLPEDFSTPEQEIVAPPAGRHWPAAGLGTQESGLSRHGGASADCADNRTRSIAL